MTTQELFLMAILVFILMNTGLFLTMREFWKFADNPTVQGEIGTKLPHRMTRRLS